MEQNVTVSNLFDRVNDLRERIVALESAHTAEQRALEIQAKEYERRLEALNGEAARIASIARESVRKEMFDAKLAEVRALSEADFKTLHVIIRSIENWRWWVTGASVATGVIVGLLAKLVR